MSAAEPSIARRPGTLSGIPADVSPAELAVGSIKVLFYICGRNSPCDRVAFLIRTDRVWTSRLGLCLYFFDSGKSKIRVTGNIGVEMNLQICVTFA